MDIDKLINLGVEVRRDALGCRLCTFGSGGKVDFLLRPDRDNLAQCISLLNDWGEKYYVIGRGSNLLISDRGYSGALISLDRLNGLSVNGNTIYAESGVRLGKAVELACKSSLTGLEFAVSIPASMGGAISMNAGAYMHEIGDYVSKCTVLNGDKVKIRTGDEMSFGYRSSAAKSEELVIIDAELSLNRGSPEYILGKCNEYKSARRAAQPAGKSAGSVFKKYDGVGAGWYLERAGLKGRRVGGAEVSRKHANFIINVGGATTADYIGLMEIMREEVQRTFHITLCEEVIIIGEK